MFWAFAGLGFCFARAGNAFWSLLLQLAAQVLAPGVGDVASALTSRAASAVGRLSPKEKCVVFSSFTISLTTTPRSGPGLTGVQFLRIWATLGFCDHLHGILFVIRDCFKSGLLGQPAI